MNILSEEQRLQILENAPELTSVILQYWELSDVQEFVVEFSKTNNTCVTTLGFYESALTDELLRVLAGLKDTGISTLCVSDMESSITDVGVAHLATLTRLKSLEISGNLTSECLSTIFTELPSLSFLHIFSPHLTPEDIKPFLEKARVQGRAIEVYLNGTDFPVSLEEKSHANKALPGLFSGSVHHPALQQYIDNRNMLECICESFLAAESQHLGRQWIEGLAKNVDVNALGSVFQALKAIESPFPQKDTHQLF